MSNANPRYSYEIYDRASRNVIEWLPTIIAAREFVKENIDPKHWKHIVINNIDAEGGLHYWGTGVDLMTPVKV